MAFITCFVSAKKKRSISRIRKRRKKKLLEKLVKRQQAHLGRGNGPLKSSHLKRQQAHTEKAKKEDILHTKLIVFR